MNPAEYRAAITAKAAELGFALTGFAPVELLHEEAGRLRQWLAAGLHAGMGYMERNLDKKEDIRYLYPEAAGVLVFAFNYYAGERFTGNPGSGKISRYAWGRDYHDVLTAKLYELMEFCSGLISGFAARPFVDAAPVMDKAWAVRAGIGWMGKNTNVINPSLGSYFFIAGLAANINLGSSVPVPDHCGTCTACLDACPTGAFPQPYMLDAGRCISYLTIENKNPIPGEFAGKFDDWFFGCDICQEVCPWNQKFSVANAGSSLYSRGMRSEARLPEIMEMNNDDFKQQFGGTPLTRPKLPGLQRNAAFLLSKNSKE